MGELKSNYDEKVCKQVRDSSDQIGMVIFRSQNRNMVVFSVNWDKKTKQFGEPAIQVQWWNYQSDSEYEKSDLNFIERQFVYSAVETARPKSNELYFHVKALPNWPILVRVHPESGRVKFFGQINKITYHIFAVDILADLSLTSIAQMVIAKSLIKQIKIIARPIHHGQLGELTEVIIPHQE